ncbi:hypothetical protein D3C84_1167320 [compost metagenome]
MGEQQVFDFLGRNVLALADNHILEPAGQNDTTIGPAHTQVTGAKKTVVIE